LNHQDVLAVKIYFLFVVVMVVVVTADRRRSRTAFSYHETTLRWHL